MPNDSSNGVSSPRSNAADPATDMADWLMVQSHGKTYVGRPLQVSATDTAEDLADHAALVEGTLESIPAASPGPAHVPADSLGLVPRAPVANIANIADDEGALTLDPVFEYVTLMMPTPQGPALAVSIRPCFSLSVTRLRIVSYGVAVRIGDLTREERRGIESQIRETLEALGRSRAAQAGVLVADAGALGRLDANGWDKGKGGVKR